MNINDLNEIMECSRNFRNLLSVPVMLDHGEALKLIVADLTEKYHYNVERGDKEWVEIFEKVLSYYLTPEEMKQVCSSKFDYHEK